MSCQSHKTISGRGGVSQSPMMCWGVFAYILFQFPRYECTAYRYHDIRSQGFAYISVILYYAQDAVNGIRISREVKIRQSLAHDSYISHTGKRRHISVKFIVSLHEACCYKNLFALKECRSFFI